MVTVLLQGTLIKQAEDNRSSVDKESIEQASRLGHGNPRRALSKQAEDNGSSIRSVEQASRFVSVDAESVGPISGQQRFSPRER